MGRRARVAKVTFSPAHTIVAMNLCTAWLLDTVVQWYLGIDNPVYLCVSTDIIVDDAQLAINPYLTYVFC